MTDGVVAEIVIDPAPTPAEMIPAPDTTSALLNVPVDELVVLPEADNEIVEATPVFEIVIVDRFDANPMPAPATRLTDPVLALSENAAAVAPDAPIIVMDDAPLLIVMFAPATKETLDDDPFKLKFVATGDEIEIVEALLVNPIAPPATIVADPVLPFRLNMFPVGAEIEIVDALLVIPSSPPTTIERLPVDPLSAETTGAVVTAITVGLTLILTNVGSGMTTLTVDTSGMVTVPVLRYQRL